METLKELFNAILPVVITVFLPTATAIGVYFGTKVKTLLDTKIKRELAEISVTYVEQVFTALHGQDKFDQAKQALIDLATAKGIKIPEAELKVLIESAVNGFNQGVAE